MPTRKTDLHEQDGLGLSRRRGCVDQVVSELRIPERRAIAKKFLDQLLCGSDAHEVFARDELLDEGRNPTAPRTRLRTARGRPCVALMLEGRAAQSRATDQHHIVSAIHKRTAKQLAPNAWVARSRPAITSHGSFYSTLKFCLRYPNMTGVTWSSDGAP